MNILICSPHLDDAVLNCSDHISSWKTQGHHVEILTIFTKFKAQQPTSLGLSYINKSGFSSFQKFEKQRQKEDKKAMRSLGVMFHYGNLIDAAFRGNSTALYETNEVLFSGNISSKEEGIVEKVFSVIQKLGTFDITLIPLGVGGHIDHVIVKKCMEHKKTTKIFYYIDFPYALKLNNWSLGALKKVFTHRTSWKWTSPEKRNILATYSSQMSLLFSNKILYPEIILF